MSEADVVEWVRDWDECAPRRIVTVNVEFVMLARHHREFADALRTADLATADSAGIVWALRRHGASLSSRVGGSDLIWSISRLAAVEGRRIFLLGAGEGVAEEVGSRLAACFPGLQIAGAHAGSPSADEEEKITALIRTSRTDILFVAFGAPQQDLWIARNLSKTGALLAMGVGGGFDYAAGRSSRAPTWMQGHGLDWLWRLVHQPWRWRRMLVLPQFVWHICWTKHPA